MPIRFKKIQSKKELKLYVGTGRKRIEFFIRGIFYIEIDNMMLSVKNFFSNTTQITNSQGLEKIPITKKDLLKLKENNMLEEF